MPRPKKLALRMPRGGSRIRRRPRTGRWTTTLPCKGFSILLQLALEGSTCDSLAPGVLGVRGALQGHGSTRSAESLRRCCSSPTTPGSPRNVPSYWEIIVESAAAQTPSPPRPNGERLRTSHDSSASAAIQSSSDPSCGRITQYTWRARVRRVDEHNTWSEPDGPGQEYPRRASATGRCRR